MQREEIEKTGHDYQLTDQKKASCETGGYEKYVCSKCGDTYTKDLPETGHEAGEWKTVKNATCTEIGSKQLICSICGTVLKTEDIPVINHKYQEVSRTDATCSGEGSVIYSCSVCGDSYTEVLPKLEHDWKVIYHADPTCLDGEITTYQCTLCGELTGTETGEPLGHNFVFKRRFKEPTCTTSGRDDYECTRCYTLEFHTVPTIAHDWYVAEHLDPTCIRQGHDLMQCHNCNSSYYEWTDTIDHIAGEWEIETEPTDLTYGRKARKCTMCGFSMESAKILPTNEEQNQYYEVRTGKNSSTQVYGHYVENLSEELYTLVNEYRVENGLEAYERDETLEQMAQTRAVEIEVLFDHERPDGQRIRTLCEYLEGENIGMMGSSASTAEDIMRMFKNSAPHNTAILASYANCQGISVFAVRLPEADDKPWEGSPYGLLVVMDFGYKE